jgi:hypothetical protein
MTNWKTNHNLTCKNKKCAFHDRDAAGGNGCVRYWITFDEVGVCSHKDEKSCQGCRHNHLYGDGEGTCGPNGNSTRGRVRCKKYQKK